MVRYFQTGIHFLGGITELPIYKINDDLFQPDKHSITYVSL